MQILKAFIRRLFGFGCCIFIATGAGGQPAFNPDSLMLVAGSEASSLEKGKALKQLAENYIKSDPELSLAYTDQLQAIARESGAQGFLADAYWLKGRAYLSMQVYDTAIGFCDSGISISTAAGLTDRLAEIGMTKGSALFYSQGPEAAIIPYQSSYGYFASIPDSAGMAKALNGLGVMYKKMAQYDSAVACYIQLIGIAERKGYESTLGMGYLNLGILYQDYKEFDKAYPYLTLSIPINEKYRPDLVALAHMNVGLINYSKGNLDSALFYFRKSLGMYVANKDKNSIADVYNNIGNAYYDAHNLDSAFYYFKKAKDLYKQLSYWYTYAQVNNNIALVYMDREMYDKALQLLDTSLYFAQETHNTELLSVIYKNKYLIYNSKNDYRKALENYLLHDSLQDLIYNLDKDKVIADLEMRYQDEKKQAQILALEKINLQKDLALEKRTRQKNIFLFTGLGIILLIAFAFLYFTLRAKKDRIIAQQRIRQLEEEKKLLAARSLVEGQEEERKRIARELHDGLGVLLSTTKMQFSAIRDKLPENQALIERAVKLLEQASSDVRKISHNMMPGLLTKLGLFEAVADLFEKVSETEKIKVRAHIPEDADRMPENKEIMIYRIIQELVNNTLKHAQARTIEIKMQLIPGRLEIIYSDDGKGFDMEEKTASRSIGLQSIQSRVNFLNGKMQLYSSPGKGVSYKLEIPN